MYINNRFGSGTIYTMDELLKEESAINKPLIYCASTACLSVTSDMMSWVSKNIMNTDDVVFVNKNKPYYNNVIIVLGCQVTDLAILNDIKTAERLHNENPEAAVYMGGCLAYRFDIELPSYIKRLSATRSVNTEINNAASSLVHWENPFWVKNWDESDSDFSEGHLFRNMYPLKIGAGCHGKCKYCTIRDTRGEGYEADAFLQIKEFLNHNDVVLVSDSPTVKQIKDWAFIAKRYSKALSIRNVEPNVAVECSEELRELGRLKLLKIFHCPIQSTNLEVVRIMNRDSRATAQALELFEELRSLGVKIATNIIIDYVDSATGRFYSNIDTEYLNSHFDYWAWNPYFNGEWDINKAKNRFDFYILDKT